MSGKMAARVRAKSSIAQRVFSAWGNALRAIVCAALGLGLALSSAAAAASPKASPSSAVAPPAERRAAVDGAGLKLCSDYVQAFGRAKDQSDLKIYVGWIDGFISGVNASRTDVFDLTPWQSTETLASLVHAYCAKRPETTFASALSALVVALYPQRLTEPSPVLQLRSGSKTVFVYQRVIADLESALSKRGYVLAKDGRYDSATAAALRKFQTEQRIEVTGLPDQPTLLRLLAR